MPIDMVPAETALQALPVFLYTLIKMLWDLEWVSFQHYFSLCFFLHFFSQSSDFHRWRICEQEFRFYLYLSRYRHLYVLPNLPYLLGKNEKFECASAFAKVRFEFDYQYLILVQLRQSQPSGYPSNFTVYNLWVGCKRTEIQVIDLC